MRLGGENPYDNYLTNCSADAACQRAASGRVVTYLTDSMALSEVSGDVALLKKGLSRGKLKLGRLSFSLASLESERRAGAPTFLCPHLVLHRLRTTNVPQPTFGPHGA